MHNPDMTSGEVSLFLGSTGADIRDHSMCLHSGLRTSVKSLPLHLCPPWPLDVPPSIKGNRRGCKRFSAPSFSACFRINGCHVGDGLSTNTDGVRGAMGQNKRRCWFKKQGKKKRRQISTERKEKIDEQCEGK